MRRNNPNEMTVTEQIALIKEDTCRYACRHLENVELEFNDPLLQKAKLQGFCHECPLNKLHFESSR